MTDEELAKAYADRYERLLMPIAQKLEAHLREVLSGVPRIDRVTARAKSPERFIAKALKTNQDGSRKYIEPLGQIQDQIGARVIAFYLPDVDDVTARVRDFFRFVEDKKLVPEEPSQFGYEGHHFVSFIPTEVCEGQDIPTFFELQIKTLYQHAWSESAHDLQYKPPKALTEEHLRKFAFTAAQSWGADQIYKELSSELLN